MNPIESKFPAAFCTRMKALLGEEYPAFLASYDREMQRGLRVNTVKTDIETALAALSDLPLRPIPYEKKGFYLDCTEAGTGNHPLHHAGAFYLQEPAAMLPVASAVIREGDYVLDVCAAPGGKSTQLAAAIGREGLLVSNEFVPSRAKILLSNIERLGIPNAIVTNTDAAHLRQWYEGCFDCVVVDAPCSGEGMFRKNADAIGEWSEENVAMCADRSFEILADAAHCLRDGGTLIYATCTFAPEENEWLIARFLSENPGYTVEELPEAVRNMTARGIAVPDCREDLTRAGRCYPHVTGGEGQFVCVLKKAGDAPRAPITGTFEKLTKPDTAAVDALFSDLFKKEDSPTYVRLKGQLYAIPPHLRVSGNCFSLGVRIGEMKGSRIAPHHQLFSAYGNQMKRRWDFSADDARILRYLHGETIEITDADCTADTSDGFGCVTVCGCPLGGAKRVGSTLKNHYPKGLRIPNIRYIK
ncbi:MAG: hypothetical protein IKZ09_05290 [Clostridia bacterium]|nr:hypothetical protein [Clostridia bacterium]